MTSGFKDEIIIIHFKKSTTLARIYLRAGGVYFISHKNHTGFRKGNFKSG